MVKKKVDPRLRGLIEHGVRTNHRSMLLLVGDHGKDQVENIHKILSKTRVRARPSVLWCYKKELGFSTHRKKRMKEIKRNQSRGLHDPDVDDPFDLFISSTDIRWTYYKESEKILGQTFGMCVLQDFEALTPNLLARTIETVEGGGIIIILLKTVKSLKQLYTMTMDVHSRFRTEAHHEVVPRFNERFILSLGGCHGCLVLDDELNILPISSTVNHIPTYEGDGGEGLAEGETDASGFYLDPELLQLKTSLADTPHVGGLVELTKTIDQAKAVMSFLDAISEKTLRSTVSLTAARGRGKSAAIGICLAGAVSYGYSNIFVTAPSPENLKTVFEFLISGLKSLKYTEHLDFEVIQEHQGEVGKVVVRVNIFRHHRQTVQYILPSEHHRLAQAELVAIDEAAAIPLPIVKSLMGPYLVFMSSTINGYEGTGRSLSLKLLQQLRIQQGAAVAAAAAQAGNAVSGPKRSKGDRHIHEDRWKVSAEAAASYSSSGGGGSARILTELSLTTPIRYGTNDPIEKWLNNLLCMEVASTSATRLLGVMPAPKDCDLYVVDRDALFSYHPLAEALLQRIWALYTAAHYKNSPNDLQMLSDAPAHRLFVLLGPQKAAPAPAAGKAPSGPALPDVLCVVQVAFEGRISQKSVQSELSKGNKASGDLIPWTIAQQFNDNEFATLSGARVVRIATHPDVQKMGYGSRAIDLLLAYFQGQLTVETLHPASGLFGGEGKGADPTDTESSSGSGAAVTGLQGEEIKPKAKLPPLLTPIGERPAELLHWFGASFGLTSALLTFWSRKGFKVCYLRQTKNELTGEHSAIVLRELDPVSGVKSSSSSSSKGSKGSKDVARLLMDNGPSEGWLTAFVRDYRRRLISLMSYNFNALEAPLAITLLDPDRNLTGTSTNTAAAESDDAAPAALAPNAAGAAAESLSEAVFRPITAKELLSVHLSHHDMQRLELYSRNMVDHHMILDTLPTLTTLLFQGRMPDIRLSYLQVAIILATGLQHRDVDSIATELNLPANQVLAFFNKTVRKITSHLRGLIEADAALSLPSNEQVHRIELNLQGMTALAATLDQDQQADVAEFNTKQQQRSLIMSHKDLTKHTVGADLNQLEKALAEGMKKQLAVPKVISVPKGSTPAAPVAVLPALSAADLAAEAGASGDDKKVSKKDKKDKKKRSLASDEDEEGENEVEGGEGEMEVEESREKTPSKGNSDGKYKAHTDKKKDKSHKKSKRDSI